MIRFPRPRPGAAKAACCVSVRRRTTRIDAGSVIEQSTGERFELAFARLFGHHNHQNGAAAIAAARAVGIAPGGRSPGPRAFHPAAAPHGAGRRAAQSAVLRRLQGHQRRRFRDRAARPERGPRRADCRRSRQARLVRAAGRRAVEEGPRRGGDRRGRRAHRRGRGREGSAGARPRHGRSGAPGFRAGRAGRCRPAQPGLREFRHVRELRRSRGSVRARRRALAGGKPDDPARLAQTLAIRVRWTSSWPRWSCSCSASAWSWSTAPASSKRRSSSAIRSTF